jgi:NAD(P)-dependent dehydrogenase (short-subunit alcohol dehydrogenase family)
LSVPFRAVLVTGGARRLGAAIVRRLAADGHGVVIHYGRSADEADALAGELRARGAAAWTASADLADGGAVETLPARAAEVAGTPVDALVNSASAFVFDRPPQVDPGLTARLGAVNLSAPVRLACLVAAGGGQAVVNLLDQKVANPNPDFFSYSLSKAGLDAATGMMASAFGNATRVNAVSPGLTLPSDDQTPREFARAAAKNLLRRPVGADAVAGAVSFLLTARGITGQNLFVDCGQRFLPRDGDVMFEDRDD